MRAIFEFNLADQDDLELHKMHCQAKELYLAVYTFKNEDLREILRRGTLNDIELSDEQLLIAKQIISKFNDRLLQYSTDLDILS